MKAINPNILLPAFYFPPIAWFAYYVQAEGKILIEQQENFPKQTYRNRTTIYGANGKLSLIIPIDHSGNRAFKEIKISYAENWQKQHWKSIKIAYQSSPFFEYYEDQLITLYQNEEINLLDFNLKSISILQNALKIEKAYSLNSEFQKNPAELDLRNAFSAKVESLLDMEEYYQMFTDKYGFLKNLSILDLLCNKGPESITYLKKNNLI